MDQPKRAQASRKIPSINDPRVLELDRWLTVVNPVRAACTVCHARKVRCDAAEVGFPCTACHKASRDADCRLHQKRTRVSKKLQIELSATKDTTPATPVDVAVRSAPLDGVCVVSTADSSPSAGGLLWHLHERHLVEFVDQPHIAERPIDNTARIVYAGTSVSNIHFLASQQFGERAAAVCHWPTNQLARRETCHEPDRLPVEAFQLPSRAVVDQLLGAYFRHVNPGFPVVDERLFVTQYRARDPQNPPSLLLLQSILVVGAHVFYNEPEREAMKSTFFRRAKSLFDARFERNRDTIVQAALLMSWHADGPEDVAANGWFWIGVAVRTAMGLGMHRDADGSTIVPHNKRMWRRVWWLLFQCDVLLSMQYGRPQSIRLEDCDVKPLQPDDFQDCGPQTQIGYVIHATELCIIISQGLRERFKLASTDERRQQALQRLDQSLAQWSLQLPESLHIQPAASLELWPACLQLQYNMTLLLVHRSGPQGSPTRVDAEICAMAASFIQSIFQGICEKGDLKSLWISFVNCIFTALIQLNIEVRTSNPLVALPSLMRYDAALSSLRQFAEYWPNAYAIVHFFESVRGSRRLDEFERQEAASSLDALRSSSTQPVQGTPTAHCDPGEVDVSHLSQMPLNVSAGDGVQATPDFADAWQEWRSTYWQQASFNDDFLFTF
ncbi:hypothetical protein OQA88_9336 [Cercophora sp. LCS_1]